MFIRVLREKERKEILINTDMIWKIEVTYGVPGEDGNVYGTTLRTGIENPDAVRSYKIFCGSEEILLFGDPNCPVVKQIEEIYRNAIKG